MAYIGDKANYGFTAPLKGLRYHYEVEVNTGAYTFANLFLDYRYYQRLKPFTLAFRGMHYGRYLGNSESDILSPIFLLTGKDSPLILLGVSNWSLS